MSIALQVSISEEDHALFTIRASIAEHFSLSAWVRSELLAAAGHITESVKTRHIDKARRVVEGSSARQDIQQASIHLYDQDIKDSGNVGSWKAASLASIHLGGTVTHSEIQAQCAHNRPAGECLQCEREARA